MIHQKNHLEISRDPSCSLPGGFQYEQIAVVTNDGYLVAHIEGGTSQAKPSPGLPVKILGTLFGCSDNQLIIPPLERTHFLKNIVIMYVKWS